MSRSFAATACRSFAPSLPRPIALSPFRRFAGSPSRTLAVSPSPASVGCEFLPDCRDQEAIFAANHLRAKVTDTCHGLSPVAHRERDFETNIVSVSLIRSIDRRCAQQLILAGRPFVIVIQQLPKNRFVSAL